MRRVRIWLFLALLLGSVHAFAQNNPYDIDDECYAVFMRAEALVGKPGFDAVNDSLLQFALLKKDTKAEVLYYVGRLRQVTQTARETHNDVLVDKVQEEVKAISLQLGYPQYYYYSYELAQSYYFATNRPLRVMELVQEMHQYALDHDDDYGRWMGDRYMVSLYVNQSDFVSAKRFINRALETHATTQDSTVKRQPVCRLYCDLSDCYPIGSDSARLAINRALESQDVYFDSLRCQFYLAKFAALDYDLPAYNAAKEYCLSSENLRSVAPAGELLFKLIDGVFNHTITQEDLEQLHLVREQKYLAHILEKNGYKEYAFQMGKKMISELEQKISSVNEGHVAELEVRMGMEDLSADLEEKSILVTRSSRLLGVMALLVLLFVMAFMFFDIRNLNRNKEIDRQRINDLKDANDRALAAGAAKTRFVQNMSHEVRTPLNAIVGFSQLLALPDGSFPEQEKEEFSSHIINNAQMLTMLLDDILNASAMDSNQYKISYEDAEYHFLCRAAISSTEHRLQPGVQMLFKPDSEEPFTFRTDPRRVQQILINLLTNSCKHTAQGTITLSTSLDEIPGFVTFTVTDTGTGVPVEQAEAIFDRFVKLDTFVQGTGLGLSICRDIATRMGAKVYLDTTYTEGGARFKFEVPVNPANDPLNNMK